MNALAVIPPPAPLVPGHVNLQAYEWFPLYHKRLRRSAFWLRATDQVKALSIELWCEAYEQVPAGSLPDDDVALSEIAGFGRRDVKAWLAVKTEVMAPWILCSDGRFYHPVLSEIAIEAWNQREDKRKREREKKARQRGNPQKGDDRQGTNGPHDAVERPEDAMSPGDNHDVSQVEKPAGPQGTGGDVPREKGPQHSDKTVQKKVRSTPPTVEEKSAVAGAPQATPKTTGTRGKRIDRFWTASKAGIAYAEDKGFGPEAIRDMEESFFDFWTAKSGQGACKLDWEATWRTWVRTEANRGGGRGRDQGPIGRSGPTGGGIAPGGRGGERDASLAAMQRGALAALDKKRS